MKNKVAAFCFVGAIVFGGICLIQLRQTQALKGEVAALHQTLEERDRQKQADDRLKRALTEQQETLNHEVARLAGEMQSQRANVPNNPFRLSSRIQAPTDVSMAGQKEDGFGDLLKTMLDDPNMKKMMRQQQTAALDSMFGPLFKQLGLSSEDIEKLKELLIDNQMKGVENAGLFLNNKAEPAKRQEAAKALAEEHSQGEEQIKAFLGEERYAQYKEYQETLAERMTLNQLKEQLAGGQHPLTAEQAGQLLVIMKEEGKSVPDIVDTDSGATAGFNPFESMLSGERMEQHFQRQEDLNARVLERAKALLSPEQFAAFGGFQSNQLAMQRFGISMAVKFIGRKKSEEAVPVGEKR